MCHCNLCYIETGQCNCHKNKEKQQKVVFGNCWFACLWHHSYLYEKIYNINSYEKILDISFVVL